MATLTQPLSEVVLPEDFKKDGFAVARGLFSAHEARNWRKEADRLLKLEIIDPENLRSPFKHPHAPYPQTIDPVLDISPHFLALLDDERVQRLTQSLLGDEATPFKEELHFHLPATHNEPWHQDFAPGWDVLPQADAITLLFQMEPADDNYGCVEIQPHRHERLLDADQCRALSAADAFKIHTEPGDVIILHCLTPHRNGNNLTTYPRRSLDIAFNALHYGPLRELYYAGELVKREAAQPGHEFL